jgi:hypothetical protein
MRSRTSCERLAPLRTRNTPDHGCTPTQAADPSGPCLSPGRRVRPLLTTSERENPMPDLITLALGDPAEFPDVLAEFGGRPPAASPYDDGTADDQDGQEWPEPDEDDLDLLGRSAQAATINYRCTRRELREAGFGGGYSVEDLDGMPEIDSEFMAPAVVDDPLDYLEAPGCTLRLLLDTVERWDWTALPGFLRLVGDLIDGLCDSCPLVQP